MTAEETALEEFRSCVRGIRGLRRGARAADRNGHEDVAEDLEDMARLRRDEAAALARIIRAIRAERGMESARLAEAYGKGRVDALLRSRAEAYAQGRRDALRGVQGACLFDVAECYDHLRGIGRTGGTPSFVQGMAEGFREVAKAAEEAAR